MTRVMRAATLGVLSFLIGCNEQRQKRDVEAGDRQVETAPLSTTSSGGEQRFTFPPQANPFPAFSVALDTKTGQLCKTYGWTDNQNAPRGLPLCSELTNPVVASLIGATKAYRGFTYTFDGTKWNRGSEARKYNPTTRDTDLWSDDQYDPLHLFSKDAKAKRRLTEGQIAQVAKQFGASYEEAWDDAKGQGYQVPPQRVIDLTK